MLHLWKYAALSTTLAPAVLMPPLTKARRAPRRRRTMACRQKAEAGLSPKARRMRNDVLKFTPRYRVAIESIAANMSLRNEMPPICFSRL